MGAKVNASRLSVEFKIQTIRASRKSPSPVRSHICGQIDFLGIELDASRNAETEAVTSTPTSRTTVRVSRTDEERMIARSVRRGLVHDEVR